MVEVVAEALVVQVVEVLPLLATLAAVAAGKTCPRSAKHTRTFHARAGTQSAKQAFACPHRAGGLPRSRGWEPLPRCGM